MKIIRDIEYAQTPTRALELDLYVPEDANTPPLLVWIHGGAWRRGSKDDPPLRYGPAILTPERKQRIRAFFDRHLY